MASLGISEFTFGYAFLFEQTTAQWGVLRAAPVLPSLQQEAELGWDANLPLVGADFYYQFKLADHLTRPNAKYIKDGTYADHYFRIALHKRDMNNQHRRLRLHAQTHPDTYYVAPEVRHLDEFNNAFLARTLSQNSRLIPVAQCVDHPDDAQHYITFRSGSAGWMEHSDKKGHDVSYRGADSRKLYEDSRVRWRTLDVHFASDLFEETRESAKKREKEEHPSVDAPVRALLDEPPAHTRRDMLRRTADILSVYMGVTLVLVGEPPPVP